MRCRRRSRERVACRLERKVKVMLKLTLVRRFHPKAVGADVPRDDRNMAIDVRFASDRSYDYDDDDDSPRSIPREPNAG